jgi:hypothetical protein
MEDFSLVFERKLHWVQPKRMQRKFELCGGELIFATLEFQKIFGSLATAVASVGRWTFKRVGFFNPRVTVRREGEENDLAVYRPTWSGTHGAIDFGDGRLFHWKTANFWATRYTLVDGSGELLVTYHSGLKDARLGNLLKTQARVEIDPAAYDLAELPILVLLGWYLIILQQEDSAAVA